MEALMVSQKYWGEMASWHDYFAARATPTRAPAPSVQATTSGSRDPWEGALLLTTAPEDAMYESDQQQAVRTHP